MGRFILCENGTALDTKTQLMWMTQNDRSLKGKAPYHYEWVLDWVPKMNRRRYGGYRDWRLPSRAEYETLYDPEHRQRSYRDQPVGYSSVFAEGGGEWGKLTVCLGLYVCNVLSFRP